MKFDAVKRLVWDDGEHRIGDLSEMNAHGVRTAVCEGCGRIVVVWPNGKADPERPLLSMTCVESKRVRDAAVVAIAATPSRQKEE